MEYKLSKQDFIKAIFILFGATVYSFGMNMFIVPMGLYSSGFLGIAQILRTVCESIFGLSFGFDISGIISFFLNIPLMLLTYKTVGKRFIVKTAFCIAVQSVLLSFIPIKGLVDDPLTASIIGGILCGFGIGLALQNGGSSGGVDIIGMYFTRKSSFSVGKISMLINVFVYAAAFLLISDVKRIIYTLIFAAISMIATDRMHIQNINSEIIIISKHKNKEIETAIMKEMRRGVSYWNGYGAYTGDENRVLYIIVSKYEVTTLKKLVSSIDPKAFISIKSGIEVAGNFEKRL